jgi:short-subunit dehydrogenase
MNRIAIFGATSAIAEAVARRFAAEGASLFLVARRENRLASIANDLRARGASPVETFAADLADLRSHGAAIDHAFSAFGGLDMVLVAYGTLPDQDAAAADTAVAIAAIGVNYVSIAGLLTVIANRMAEAKQGTIAVIGSVAGDRGRQSNYVYGGAKAGLAAFAGGLRHRLWPSGVRVVLIKPGLVDTPMTAGRSGKGMLWASADRVARDIVRGMKRGSAVVYTPWFWAPVMAVVRLVPDFIFRRTRF